MSVFLYICILLLAAWSFSYRRWKLLSISFTNLVATLLFVGLGMEFHPYPDPVTSVSATVLFFVSLIAGERLGRRVSIGRGAFSNLGEFLTHNPYAQNLSLVVFMAYSLLPFLGVLASGKPLYELILGTWATNGVIARQQAVVEQSLSNATGVDALLTGLQHQLAGFWLLSLGVVFIKRRFLVYPLLVVNAVGLLLTSGGSRTDPIAAVVLPVLVWTLSASKHRWRTILVIAIVAVGIAVSLDFLVLGRQGVTASGGLMERVDRTLRQDVAYGGLGLELGMSAPPASLERGAGHLGRMLVLPIPRVVWPGKTTSDPNREMTEWYTKVPFEEYGSIWLFTPLGEGLFYFGTLGLVIIPMLYGFTTTILERLYSTSPAYLGLLAQVYVWALLGMRLTYFNVFSTLIAANFAMLSILVIAALILQRPAVPRRVEAACQV